jgi:hypothetical protein
VWSSVKLEAWAVGLTAGSREVPGIIIIIIIIICWFWRFCACLTADTVRLSFLTYIIASGRFGRAYCPCCLVLRFR